MHSLALDEQEAAAPRGQDLARALQRAERRRKLTAASLTLPLLVFLLLLIIPSLFPQANIIERLVLPPVEWISGHYMALARLVADA